MTNSRKLYIFPVLFLILFSLFSCSNERMEYDAALLKLDKLTERINSYDDFVTRRTKVNSEGEGKLSDSLPDITAFQLSTAPYKKSNSLQVEIFASTEKSGSGTDGWINEIAEEFNSRNIRTKSGKIIQIYIRKIASGTGHEFIASRKYVPTAISPSNELWIKMIEASGLPVKLVSDKLVGNTAGIVMEKSVYENLEQQYGNVNVENIINSVVNGSLFMGYTNPFASSTGLNFLQTVLLAFADGNESLMLDESVVSAFEAYQKSVPFVSLTTIQMRESVENDGSLDAFVMEYQSFYNMRSKSKYRFIPFGIRHDNPLYAVGNVSADSLEALDLFADFCLSSSSQKKAEKFGFNRNPGYRYQYQTPSGSSLVLAQKLWKEKKDSGRPIVAVFLNDISGSMGGLRIQRLREALIEGSKFISEDNYIGLVNFNHEVIRVLEVDKFDTIQNQKFNTAVKQMSAVGSTAMFDGIAVALQTLIEAQQDIPNAKPLLFVLTDGETNVGLTFSKVRKVFEGIRIPIYTISYGENISVLKGLSSLNEAASLNAGTDEISYQIGALLNAEM